MSNSQLAILFTDENGITENLFPFTETRHIADIRLGIVTLREKWEMQLGVPSFQLKANDYKDVLGVVSQEELFEQFSSILIVPSHVIPTAELIEKVRLLADGETLVCGNDIRISRKAANTEVLSEKNYHLSVFGLQYPWEIFRKNEEAIRADFEWLRKQVKSQPLSSTNTLIGSAEDLLIEEGAEVEYATLNTTTGPLYIGKNATILEGAFIRGPFALCEKGVVKMGAKIYGATTIGPYSVAAGEIKNAMLMGFSNKAHDGYLGDSVIGEWCNWGAGTTNSNLKNTAGDIFVWTKTGRQKVGQKCGVLMGDYSRTAINTAINTGTVIGVGANVFGAGLTPNYIPNFTWGASGDTMYEFDKAVRDISGWKVLKGKNIEEKEISILKEIYNKP